MRLERIVVGMDFNEPSLAAARWTARHLAPGAELVLVHSIEVPAPPDFLAEVLPPYEAAVEAARREAERPVREVSASIGAERVRTELRVGRPADQISRVAEETGADMIVVGERSVRRGAATILGSTADQLVRCAPVPVLLARNLPDGAPEAILAPVDQYELASSVLSWAGELSDRFAARLTALFALRPGLYGGLRAPQSEDDVEAMQRRVREAAEGWMRGLLADAGITEGAARTEIRFGEPAFEIVDAAEQLASALIVMGSRGAHSISPALLGGVASAVIHGASHPVLVISDGTCG